MFYVALAGSPTRPDGDVKRVALHAYSIQFNSMAKGDISITAPYPDDFAVMVKLLEKYDQLEG